MAISHVDGQPGADATRVASDADIARIAEKFGEASAVAREAGFDGVEIHGAHGFFLNRFFSPRFNARTGRYGGSLEARMQLGIECVQAARAAGDDLLVFYRHTPEEDAPSRGTDAARAPAAGQHRPTEGGYTLADSIAFVKALVRAGADVIDVSPSSRTGSDPVGPDPTGPDLTEPDQVGPDRAVRAAREAIPNGQAGLAGAIRRALVEEDARPPGGWAPRVVAGRADLVAVGRAMIADACWASKVRSGRRRDIIACRKCNEACYGNLGKGLPIGCRSSPASGWEFRARTTSASSRTDALSAR